MTTDPNEKKGFTVGEIEAKAKQHSLEIALIVIFAITAISTLLYPGSMKGWSVFFAMVLGIVGVVVPRWSQRALTQGVCFICKEKSLYMASGVIALLLAIFFPVIIFALFGWFGGTSITHHLRCHPCRGSSNKEAHTEEKH